MTIGHKLSSFFSSQGRASRSVFWWSTAALIASIAVAATGGTLFGDGGVYDGPGMSRLVRLTIVLLSVIPAVALGVQFRGVCIRRGRDARPSRAWETLRYVPYLRLLHFGALGFLPSREDPMEEAIRVFDTPASPEVREGETSGSAAVR